MLRARGRRVNVSCRAALFAARISLYGRTVNAGGDAGLADGHWRQYFTQAEVAELEEVVRVTGVIYEDVPVHVRIYHRSDEAPTILAPHGLIVYGLLCARLHLQFWHAGYNVVSWDFPGMGQSGGGSKYPTIGAMIGVWQKMIEWGSAQYGDAPVYVAGVAEDGVTSYYAGANDPRVRAFSLHHLIEFGDLDNTGWINPRWWRRANGWGVAVLERIAPWAMFKAEKAVPFEAIFCTEEDRAAFEIYRRDPLRIQRYNVHLARDMFRKRPFPVALEDCRTPVQLITSELNTIWPPRINDRAHARLGGEKELVVLEGLDQWSVSREFAEIYATHVLRWFDHVGGRARETAEALT
jgi:pimeloyl-ACP methyl ester carboxylesterase